MEIIADTKLRSRGLARGREGIEQERSIILAGFRTELSMAAANASSACLIDRIGEGQRQALKMRAWAKGRRRR